MAVTAKPKTDKYDKVRGALWGVALGDSLGAPHEFRIVPLSKYTGSLIYPYARLSRWQGRRTGVIGQVTDDTEMTVCLADSIVNGYGYDVNVAIDGYMTWANSTPPMGMNTRRLLYGVKTLTGYKSRFAKHEQEVLASQSNGCLMRCVPLMVCGVESAVADCKITNPNPVCVDACRVYHTMLNLALDFSRPIKSIITKALGVSQEAIVRDTIMDSQKRNVSHQSGWVLHALWCAVYALRMSETKCFSEVIDTVVRLGGDTDTNAAIAGGLLGSRYGYTAMENDKKTSANIEIVREADYDQGSLGRPSLYHPSRLDFLSQLLCDLPD